MRRNIISFHALFKQGFRYSFDDENSSISSYKNGVFYFKALPCDGVYETMMIVDNLGNSVFQIDSSNAIDKTCLWHLMGFIQTILCVHATLDLDLSFHY